MDDGVAIEARGLTKIYGEGDTAVHALQSVDLQIEPGEFVVLLGPSGSGKTTLLNEIGALESATSGTIAVNGVDIGGLRGEEQTAYRRNTVGFVFQFYNLIPTLTAFENVALIAEITGPGAAERTRHVLDEVGLSDRADAFPSQLSGGQQQRVAIARGLVKDPPLMLCDEPTGALDLDTGRQVLALLREVTRGTRRTVVLVTHNSAIAEMADRVIRLRDGSVIGDTPNPSPTPAEDLVW